MRGAGFVASIELRSLIMPALTKTIPRKVNVAVVGLGFMGRTHLRVYLENPQAQVVAVCGLNRVPVNGVLAGIEGNVKKTDDIVLRPGVKVFRSFERLLAEPDIDLVDLCTPTALHPAQAIAALKAGKHVLCEKPLALTSRAAVEVLKSAESAPGFLMPAMCMRFWPGWSWLKRIVAEKIYGEILAARFCRFSEMPAWTQANTFSDASASGGALFDFHIHDTDFIHYLFGRPAGVFSTGVIDKASRIDHVTTQYHYPHGPAVHAEASWLRAQGFNMAYTLHCEKATVDFDMARGVAALTVLERGHSPQTIQLELSDGYTEEIRYFVDCIGKNSPPETVTVRDALTALEICEAEEKSIRNNCYIKI